MTATIAPVRPTLDVEAKARNNCRYRLGGLRCTHDGKVRTIRSTTWRKEPGLWLFLKASPDPVHASQVVLIDRWPPTCCRSTLRTDGMPRGSAPMKRSRIVVVAEDPPWVPDEIEAAEDSGRPFATNLGSGKVTFLDGDRSKFGALGASARHDTPSKAKADDPAKSRPLSLCGPGTASTVRGPDSPKTHL